MSVRSGGERLRERMQGMKEFSLFSSHTVTFPILDSKNTLKQRRDTRVHFLTQYVYVTLYLEKTQLYIPVFWYGSVIRCFFDPWIRDRDPSYLHTCMYSNNRKP
jgi:hypothetical protein